MKTVRCGSVSFTGTAWQQPFAISDGPALLHASRITSKPSARTVRHSHLRGQVLVAMAGVGRYLSHAGTVLVRVPDDSVDILAGGRHWHGAVPDRLFGHTLMQAEEGDSEQAEWMQAVSDDGYSQTRA